MTQRNILITGSNRGIGLELTKQFLSQGDQVFALCRKSSSELIHLKPTRIFEGMDVLNSNSIRDLPSKLLDTKIDILINNAGILIPDNLQSLDEENVFTQFLVNALGPLKVVKVLLSSLKKNAKLIFLTSRMGSIADNNSGSYYGYRASKAALNAIAVSLAKDLSPRGISVGIFHPGMVATRMSGGQGISITESVEGLIKRIESLNLHNSGKFFHQNGKELPW
ncbi:oxidoreductase, short chain dehydrogenase/reductase family protein [Leptospira interrogans serovar Grippotyphosa str. LT2186]|uniref:Oxidoreductase, short chain dehydrogenase/reductase family protein n=1 Tax=Leptospira interrogans serovar Grippotyphosa str. LT2186 TaxID=1001599 RepID=M3HDH4_LEPIR|nr:SDR family oxidoreductase [Leptospira interrogans]EJP13701.1 oxidoreductase, short chain dehydrogenase/reductase family protein [Leptospira interrogans str. FPW2026]EKR43065.1 oxidoreductase, short chain dehydrogenase/reductase family protein [Leptospira interrogans serovar Grippotyphosa str. UI 08368]EMG10725.1 oxidoreductase, short chain dehydrogenase/reductase family protein [Leptospira interrogans serovar Grippotyphosa str. LT2186]EMN85812.1 oxidoreductase, short chain dehydrogenase/redu